VLVELAKFESGICVKKEGENGVAYLLFFLRATAAMAIGIKIAAAATAAYSGVGGGV